MKKVLLFAAVSASAAVASPAIAQTTTITYIGQQQVGSIYASYSVTTNGAIGNQIAASNIIAYNIDLFENSSLSYQLTQSNSFSQGFFDATTSSLSANRASLSFGSFGLSSRSTFLGSFGIAPGLTFAEVTNNSTGVAQETAAANAPFARVAAPVSMMPAIPEPATWAMMILGFGVLGGAMRRQRRVRATVRFA